MLHWLGIEHEDALLLGDEDDLECKVNEGIQLMTRDAERRGISSIKSLKEQEEIVIYCLCLRYLERKTIKNSLRTYLNLLHALRSSHR